MKCAECCDLNIRFNELIAELPIIRGGPGEIWANDMMIMAMVLSRDSR